MTYGLEVVDEVAAEALKLFGEMLAAGEIVTRAPWRGSVPWDEGSRASYSAQHPDAPLPAFQDGLARPEQLLPGTPGAADQTMVWPTWYILGGRGSGKTRPASEALAEWIAAEPGDYAVMAPTFGDARDTCVEGPSGLIRAFGGTSSVNLGPLIRKWNRSEGKLFHQNGSVVICDGADDGGFRVQGKNLTGAWCDEVGLWRRRAKAKSGSDPEREPWYLAWVESLGFAVRIGRARIIATGTPKQGHPLVKMLLNDPMVVKSHLKTTDNAVNLSPVALARFLELFEGTRIGRQELGGEYLEDVAGALWTLAQIEADRITQEEFDLLGLTIARVVIGVDPSGGVTETGIVKMALASDGHGYVFEDATAPGSPDVWGKAVVACFDREPNGDRVIPEMNQGGAMVIHVLRTVDENIPIKPVNAKVGKAARAEPISALCEQHKIHHVGTFPKLEDELCLAAGSLVTALRGDIPIEDIQAGELVLTRAGWAPVAWAGQTGVADLTSVTHASGDIYLTACHPVFVMELGRFVSARNVRPGQHLRGAPSRADMVSRLRGAGGGTAGCDAATSGIPKAGCSIGSPGRRTTAPQVIGGAGTSTTSTMIQGTTGWATWPGSPSRLMSPSMSPVGLRAMTLDVVIGRESSGRSGMGMTPSVRSVAPGIGLRRCVQLPAPLSAVESVRTDVSGRHGVPVFNLKVEVGYLPEFYAGGVLVHNCQWVPDSGAASPNRLDAYVWAATDLFIRRKQQAHEAMPIQITRQSTWKMGG